MSGQGQMESEIGRGGEGQGTKEERDKKGKKGGCTMTGRGSLATCIITIICNLRLNWLPSVDRKLSYTRAVTTF